MGTRLLILVSSSKRDRPGYNSRRRLVLPCIDIAINAIAPLII